MNTSLHVAIIMDGNRRWAKAKHKPAHYGHQVGVKTLENIIKASPKLGVKYLTLYALSSENLQKRSKLEIQFLLKLMEKAIKEKIELFEKNNVCLKIIGDLRPLPLALQDLIKAAEKKLERNNGLFLSIAINYGGRQEILGAINNLNKKVGEVTQKDLESRLFTTFVPDPDLIIRTGGQKRLSNFLLWQVAYSELYFIDTLWPDFDKDALAKAIKEFEERKRNWGQ